MNIIVFVFSLRVVKLRSPFAPPDVVQMIDG